jgi:hypothetical protein
MFLTLFLIQASPRSFKERLSFAPALITLVKEAISIVIAEEAFTQVVEIQILKL